MRVKNQLKLPGLKLLPGILRLQPTSANLLLWKIHGNHFTNDFETAIGCNKFPWKTLSLNPK